MFSVSTASLGIPDFLFEQISRTVSPKKSHMLDKKKIKDG
jgi:hypothetical protein